MKRVILFAALVAASALFGDTFRTNDVDGLVYLLKAYNGGGHTIELEPGDYNLTEECSWYTNSSVYASYLYLTKIYLKGVGDNREAVKLIGDGSLRVIYGDGSATIENLTVTNGYAMVADGYTNSGRGGGVYGGVTVTNCLITCNYAQSYGGGGAGGVKFVDCDIIGNEAGNSGGGFHSSSATLSRFVENVARNSGGAVYTAKLYECAVISNRTTESYGGGGYNVTYATNCLFAFNHSADPTSGGGGAVANGSSANRESNVLYDCTIVSNTAAYNGGGAYMVTLIGGVVKYNTAAASFGGVLKCIVHDAEISHNTALRGDGGGAYDSVVSNCTVFANTCSSTSNNSYGGGVNKCTVYDSEIYGNCAWTRIGADGKNKVGSAGGAHESTLYNCRIYDNYSDSYGGGVRSCHLYDCRLENNCASNDGWNSYGSYLHDCVVSGTGVFSSRAERTIFREIGNEVVMDANMYVDTPFTNKTLWKGFVNATNCLFAFNNLTYIFQYSVASERNSSFINCTVVSNSYDNLFNNCKTAYPMTVENSLFIGNKKLSGSSADISVPGLSSGTACQEHSISFKNCAYGKLSASGGLDVYLEEGAVMYQFGNDFPSDPKFQHHRDAAHPFALRRTSPLIGKGKHEVWMDTATDLRGEGFARANGESVDIGCYQCWLKPAGTVFSIR